METKTGARPRTMRIALTPEAAEALEARAKRNDRLPWLEAGRIIRETLERDGDVPDAHQDAAR